MYSGIYSESDLAMCHKIKFSVVAKCLEIFFSALNWPK